MKKCIIALLIVVIVCALGTWALNTTDDRPDYVKLMVDAAHEGQITLGRGLEELRGLVPGDEGYMSFDDLYLLSQYLDALFQHPNYSNTVRKCMSELIVNRINSRAYPNTMSEVLMQSNVPHIAGVVLMDHTKPATRNVEIAAQALCGDRNFESAVTGVSTVPVEKAYATCIEDMLTSYYFYKE